jgi:hypothetical protein
MTAGADRPADLRCWVDGGVRSGVWFKPDIHADIAADTDVDTELGSASAATVDLSGNCPRLLGSRLPKQEEIRMHGELQEL